MKCEKCGSDMLLYKQVTHMHWEEKRWHCYTCDNEFIEPEKRELPKYEEKKDKK